MFADVIFSDKYIVQVKEEFEVFIKYSKSVKYFVITLFT